jgi:ABC-type glycerol-3-phosphate transport system substrate-binding protein
MVEVKRETDLVPQEFWKELISLCNRYLGSKGEGILNDIVEILGKSQVDITFGDLTDIYNALINKLVYLDKRADFRAELYTLRRKYMIPPEILNASPSPLEKFLGWLTNKRNATALSIILILIVGIGVYFGLKSSKEKSVISGKYDIVLWSQLYSRNMENSINKVIEEFNKRYQPYKARIDLLPGGQDPMAEMGTQMKIMAVFAAGDPPDILYGTANPLYLKSPYLLPISRNDVGSLHYFPDILSQVKINEKELYGYPVSLNPKLLVIGNIGLIKKTGYNPEVIQKNGITWDEFISLTDKLKLITPYPVIINLRGASIFDIFWMFMVNNGSGRATDGDKFLWSEKKIEESFYYFNEWVKRDIINANLLSGAKVSSNIDLFNEGKVGIIIGNHMDYLIVKNTGKVNVRILPFPHNTANDSSSLWDIYSYFCFKQRDNYNQDKAPLTLLLAKTLSENALWVLDTGGLPASQDLWAKLNLLPEEDYKFLYSYIAKASPVDTNPLFQQIAMEGIAPGLEGIITKKSTPQQTLANIKSNIDRILSQYNR